MSKWKKQGPTYYLSQAFWKKRYLKWSLRGNLKKDQKVTQVKKSKCLLTSSSCADTRPRSWGKTLLVQDFSHGYPIAGHVIWHGHFLKFWSSSKVPLKSTQKIKFGRQRNGPSFGLHSLLFVPQCIHGVGKVAICQVYCLDQQATLSLLTDFVFKVKLAKNKPVIIIEGTSWEASDGNVCCETRLWRE